jgi:hypothetical protein
MPKIAQCPLGDLNFINEFLSLIVLPDTCQAYYSGKVKDLWYIHNEYQRHLE